MLKFLHNQYIIKLYFVATNFSEKYIVPFIVFLMRLQIAQIFWYSGLVKIGSWDSTLYLFEYEYKVPLISFQVAAWVATAIELVMPWLLLVGLMSRFAAIPLLFMTAVIQFTYLDRVDHLYWAFLLTIIIFYGPGRYSIDHFLRFKCKTWYNNMA